MKAILFKDQAKDFQYQKGAIKTDDALRKMMRRAAFQYQKGAIKTVYRLLIHR